MSRFVLDSYAMLAHFLGEDAGPRVRQLLTNNQHEFLMTVVNLAEVYYRTARERSEEVAEETMADMANMPITFIEIDRGLALDAGRIKANYTLSYADCLAAALANRLDAAVVTGDPEFERLEAAGIASIEWLASRPKHRRRR